jgi:hypothetical protein
MTDDLEEPDFVNQTVLNSVSYSAVSQNVNKFQDLCVFITLSIQDFYTYFIIT